MLLVEYAAHESYIVVKTLCYVVTDMQSRNRATWSGVELLRNGRELTTKVGEQP